MVEKYFRTCIFDDGKTRKMNVRKFPEVFVCMHFLLIMYFLTTVFKGIILNSFWRVAPTKWFRAAS